MYNGTKIKKGYYGSVQVFASEHTVTYRVKNQSWTGIIEDGENAVTSSASSTARGKMGSGDTFVGWTKTNGSTSPSSSITCNDDGMTLYGIWRHAHIGDSETKAGCYQGAASSYNPISNTGGDPVEFDGCGCQHQNHYWTCGICGHSWKTRTNYSGNCTQGHSLSDDNGGGCSHDRTITTYALSCGKSAGTFCG